jgi:hypothetical protein
MQVIGHAAAERLLLSGSMVPPQRALQLGLVDELVADKAQLLTRAEVGGPDATRGNQCYECRGTIKAHVACV